MKIHVPTVSLMLAIGTNMVMAICIATSLLIIRLAILTHTIMNMITAIHMAMTMLMPKVITISMAIRNITIDCVRRPDVRFAGPFFYLPI
jgi:hypothetical protein